MNLVWVNGAFGVGKSRATQLATASDTRWRLFDPETVGYMLRVNLADLAGDDFQDFKAWRTLVPAVAHAVMEQTGDDLVAVQTVLNESYWRELREGLSDRGITVKHIVLDADAEALTSRIENDERLAMAVEWRLPRASTPHPGPAPRPTPDHAGNRK